jgi:hypothetical protein
MEAVLPTPGSVPAPEEALLRVRDLTMMQAFNSREREMDDWEQLFAAVSREENASAAVAGAAAGRLVLKRLMKPFGSIMSVMEVEWALGAVDERPAPIKPEPGVASPGRLGMTMGMNMGMGMGMGMGMSRGMCMGMNGRVTGMIHGCGNGNGCGCGNGSGNGVGTMKPTGQKGA